MQVPYDEGLASHIGPESCVGVREGGGVFKGLLTVVGAARFGSRTAERSWRFSCFVEASSEDAEVNAVNVTIPIKIESLDIAGRTSQRSGGFASAIVACGKSREINTVHIAVGYTAGIAVSVGIIESLFDIAGVAGAIFIAIELLYIVNIGAIIAGIANSIAIDIGLERITVIHRIGRPGSIVGCVKAVVIAAGGVGGAAVARIVVLFAAAVSIIVHAIAITICSGDATHNQITSVLSAIIG